MQNETGERIDNLERYLKQIDRVFDIPRVINERQEKLHVVRYYAHNKLTYRLFYDWTGFYHVGISYDGSYKQADVREQARITEGYMHDVGASRVLEIGCGLGPNCAFLARRNPYVVFEASDFSSKPLRCFRGMPNLHFFTGDYHDLSGLADNTYDIVFAIETLCYSTNKSQVFHEVKQKLKPGGKFIIFDIYRHPRAKPLSPSEELMARLIEKGVAAQTFERVDDVEEYMRGEFSIEEAKDLSTCVLPCLDRQEAFMHFYFNHPIFARASGKLVPFDVVKNTISVLLLPTSMRRHVDCYYMHVLANDR
ncbi:MAG: class I SAM-dependent methyltransferase [Halobacteriota archaeon]